MPGHSCSPLGERNIICA